METTILSAMPEEEQLKTVKVLGKPIWQYTEESFAKLGLQYRQCQPQDIAFALKIWKNRNFLVDFATAPKKPVLYFASYYPVIPEDCFSEFLQQATDKVLSVLYHPSEKWSDQKEILCILWQPPREGELAENIQLPDFERTLAFPVKCVSSSEAFSILSEKRNRKLIAQGVIILDSATTWIDEEVEIEAGTILYPSTRICGKSRIGKGCQIGPNCDIINSKIGDDNSIRHTQIEDSIVEANCNIGPFSYIRPHSRIGNRVRIGDFVEIKNASIGDDTMISHLTYVGDADVGKGVNFGCGTVIVNYDGNTKHRSRIEDHAFIGCNSNLISPVQIGEGAYIAAGSTITDNLPAQSLGIARVRQEIKENWVTNRKDADKGGKTNE